VEDQGGAITGYVATKGEDVLELFADPAHPGVANQLLERVCGDAIEMDCHDLGLFAPPGDALADLFLAVGGYRQSAHEPDCRFLMARVPEPAELLRRLEPMLQRRADAANLERPCALGFALDTKRGDHGRFAKRHAAPGQSLKSAGDHGELEQSLATGHVGHDKYCLTLTRRGLTVSTGKLSRAYLRLDWQDFTRLLLGALHWEGAIAAGRIRPSSRLASRLATALFPRRPLGRPPLDDLLE